MYLPGSQLCLGDGPPHRQVLSKQDTMASAPATPRPALRFRGLRQVRLAVEDRKGVLLGVVVVWSDLDHDGGGHVLLQR